MSTFRKLMDDADMHMAYAEKIILAIEGKDEEQNQQLAHAFYEVRKAQDSFRKACDCEVAIWR